LVKPLGIEKQEGREFFSAYNPTSASYIYDEAGGQAATSGQFFVEKYDEKIIQIAIPTLGSTSIDVRIEGRVKDAGSGRWGEVWTKNYAAATTIDELVVIPELLEYIRVGVKVNTNGTDSITILGSFRKRR